MKHTVLITNDVETTSIVNHRLRDKTADYLLSQGMPRLLDLYEKFNIRCTFFFTGYVARLQPELVKMAVAKGHEIGSHGLYHTQEHAFDILPFDTQIEHLKISKKILEDIGGQAVTSFRAPAARIDNELPRALEIAGYCVDSSVSSQRLDMFMSFGSIKKLNWLSTPRKSYFTSQKNIFRKGQSKILEIPITALAFPYIGTFMRIAPGLNRMLRQVLYLETLATGRLFNFVTHPNEFIDEDREGGDIERRGTNVVSYLLGDVLRHRLKLRNLGAAALPILERELAFFKFNGFEFKTCSQVYDETKQSG
jgi:hypothetical protein